MLDCVADMIDAYRLRYEVYGELGYLRHLNTARLEIDEYDAMSVPFGAFDSETGELIGTLRLITLERLPDYAALLRRIITETGDPELAKQALRDRPHLLPSIISTDIVHQIDAFNTEGYVIGELSRCIVRPGRRGAGVSRALMEFGLAHAAQYEPMLIVGACLPAHVAMYARYGYQKLPQTGIDRFDSVGQYANAVVCRTDVLPEPTRNQVYSLVAAIKNGPSSCKLEIGRDSYAMFHFAAQRRPRRRTIEW